VVFKALIRVIEGCIRAWLGNQGYLPPGASRITTLAHYFGAVTGLVRQIIVARHATLWVPWQVELY